MQRQIWSSPLTPSKTFWWEKHRPHQNFRNVSFPIDTYMEWHLWNDTLWHKPVNLCHLCFRDALKSIMKRKQSDAEWTWVCDYNSEIAQALPHRTASLFHGNGLCIHTDHTSTYMLTPQQYYQCICSHSVRKLWILLAAKMVKPGWINMMKSLCWDGITKHI